MLVVVLLNRRSDNFYERFERVRFTFSSFIAGLDKSGFIKKLYEQK